MATYKHGVYTSETSTELVPTVELASALPLVIGTSDVFMLDDPSSAVNKLVRVSKFSDYVSQLGYCPATGIGEYYTDGDEQVEYQRHQSTLSSYAGYNFYYTGNTPVYMINVGDPSVHRSALDTSTVVFDEDGTATISEYGVLKDTLVLYTGETETTSTTTYAVTAGTTKYTSSDGTTYTAGDASYTYGTRTLYSYTVGDATYISYDAANFYLDGDTDATAYTVATLTLYTWTYDGNSYIALSASGESAYLNGDTSTTAYTTGTRTLYTFSSDDEDAGTYISYDGTTFYAEDDTDQTTAYTAVYDDDGTTLSGISADDGETVITGTLTTTQQTILTSDDDGTVLVCDGPTISNATALVTYSETTGALTDYITGIGDLTTTTEAILTSDDGTIITGLSDVTSTTTTTTTRLTYTLGTDYTAAHDDDGNLVLSSLTDDSDELIMPVNTEITIAGYRYDPSLVTADDIIGGVDSETLAKTGIELANTVFAQYGEVYNIILAPYYSSDASVAAALLAKTEHTSGQLYALALIDADTESVTTYDQVYLWKSSKSIADPFQVLCWPAVHLEGTIYDMSTVLSCLLGTVDGDHDNYPNYSPSNNTISITGTCLRNGGEVVIDTDDANYLNGNGINTAINRSGSWKFWGHRTAAYPSNTDPKDAFISCRRVFIHERNTTVTTLDQRVDYPMTRKQIAWVLNTLNKRGAGLVASEKLLGYDAQFNSDDNTTTDLMDGLAQFKVYLTPASPMRGIDVDFEIDVDVYETLWSN